MKTRILGVLLGAALSLFVSMASTRAARAACTNDVDCPTAACGGQVCQWPPHMCVAAGTDPQGSDGWCSQDTDCKCMGEGAKCAGVHCTFTLPPDAGGASTLLDASSADAASTVETEDAAPVDDAGPTEVVDAEISGGIDSSVPAVGPDAGPMGSKVSGCAIGGERTSESEWAVAIGSVVCAAAAARHRRRRRR
jgi:hypothetical protein